MTSPQYHSEFLNRPRHTGVIAHMAGRDITSSAEAREVLSTIINDIPPPGHAPQCIGVTMDDQVICECGWKSTVFWDGNVWAWDEWTNHMADVYGLEPLQPS